SAPGLPVADRGPDAGRDGTAHRDQPGPTTVEQRRHPRAEENEQHDDEESVDRRTALLGCGQRPVTQFLAAAGNPGGVFCGFRHQASALARRAIDDLPRRPRTGPELRLAGGAIELKQVVHDLTSRAFDSSRSCSPANPASLESGTSARERATANGF